MKVIIGAMSERERVNVPELICIMRIKRIRVFIIVALEAILRFDGVFVRNNITEVIRKIKNKTARIFPSIAIINPLFSPNNGDSPADEAGNHGRSVRIKIARFIPSAVLRRLSSFFFEKE